MFCGQNTLTIIFDFDGAHTPPADLLRYIQGGHRAYAQAAPNGKPEGGPIIATLELVAGFYTMKGRTGLHRLNAAEWATDAGRLWAHWQGFIENNRRISP